MRALLHFAPGSVAILLFSATMSSAQSVRTDLYVTDGSVYTTTEVGGILYLGGWFTWVGPRPEAARSSIRRAVRRLGLASGCGRGERRGAR